MSSRNVLLVLDNILQFLHIIQLNVENVAKELKKLPINLVIWKNHCSTLCKSLISINICYWLSLLAKKKSMETRRMQNIKVKYLAYFILGVFFFSFRVITLINNYSQDNHTHAASQTEQSLTPEEHIIEIGLLSTFNSMLQQCSTPIYKVRTNVYWR
jgi:Na+/H+ antiporter NhaA